MKMISTIIVLFVMCGIGWAMDPWNNSQVTRVAQTICAEAASESDIGMHAIAAVIKNRMTRRHMSAYEVVTEPSQFAYRSVAWCKMQGDSWATSLSLAQILVQGGYFTDPTMGATHFYSGTKVPYWVPKMKNTCQIGHHKFFRE